MRRGMCFRRSLFLSALIPSVLFLTVSCAETVPRQHAKGGSGETISWTPPVPQIGDLVKVEAFIPASAGGPSALYQKGNPPVPPRGTAFSRTGTKLFWAFRVTGPGDWFFGSPESGESAVKLWSVATVAGESDGLKTVDAQSLWSGKKTPVKAAP